MFSIDKISTKSLNIRFAITIFLAGFLASCDPSSRNSPPTAIFTLSTPNGSLFRFDATASYDDETPRQELKIRWDWNGDGTWDSAYDTVKTGSYEYASSGSFTVIMEVADSDSLTDTGSMKITAKVLTGGGTFTDDRDGKEYRYVNIGSQRWMMDNLAWLPQVDPPTQGSIDDPGYYVYGYSGDQVAEAKSMLSYVVYGALYNWQAAVTACPGGWHLPTDGEWKELEGFLGMTEEDQDLAGLRTSGAVGRKLKSEFGYNSNGGGDNSSGFNALAGGRNFLTGDVFGDQGNDAYFWTSSESEAPIVAWYRTLFYGENGVYREKYFKSHGYSVRCIKN